jgi:hypothetical protein
MIDEEYGAPQLSPATSRRIDWEAIRAILVLILDQLPGDRAGGGVEAVRITPEEIRRAFGHVDAEFGRVLGPLRRQLTLLHALLPLAFAAMSAGAALSLVDAWGSAVLTMSGALVWSGLSWSVLRMERDRTTLELIPARYRLALESAENSGQFKSLLNQFLLEIARLVGKDSSGIGGTVRRVPVEVSSWLRSARTAWIDSRRGRAECWVERITDGSAWCNAQIGGIVLPMKVPSHTLMEFGLQEGDTFDWVIPPDGRLRAQDIRRALSPSSLSREQDRRIDELYEKHRHRTADDVLKMFQERA